VLLLGDVFYNPILSLIVLLSACLSSQTILFHIPIVYFLL
jgi:hypothetical protein